MKNKNKIIISIIVLVTLVIVAFCFIKGDDAIVIEAKTV